MRLAYVFPGQGAQYVGMGRELADTYPIAGATFEAADAALGYAISKMCVEGPEEDLRLTYHTQPALLTVSTMAFRVFQHELTNKFGGHEWGISPVVVAGHSLGEYSALVAANAIDFEDAVRLVHRRGKWMDQAVPAGIGAMCAVLGLDSETLETVCREASDGADLVELANVNCPGQIVISGTAAAVARASELAKAKGARRVIPLVVSGPFHSGLMRPASEHLSGALRQTVFREAEVPLAANVDAEFYTAPDDIRSVLEKQLYSPVRWQQDVEAILAAGVDAIIEFGPGTVLSGLIKKVDKQAVTLHVEDVASLQETLRAIRS